MEGIVNYPEIFPCSLISCALLEKAKLESHDFKRNPCPHAALVGVTDCPLQQQLKSYDPLYILVEQHPESSAVTLNKTGVMLRVYDCYGLVEGQKILFRARLSLAPLEEILNGLSRK